MVLLMLHAPADVSSMGAQHGHAYMKKQQMEMRWNGFQFPFPWSVSISSFPFPAFLYAHRTLPMQHKLKQGCMQLHDYTTMVLQTVSAEHQS